MKIWTRFLALMLCVCLLLSLIGCSKDSQQVSVPDTEPLSDADVRALYASARQPVDAAANLSMNMQYTQSRGVGAEAYTEQIAATAAYTGLGTGSMEALINENLTIGTYEAQYTQSYMDGAAYCQVSGCSFTTPMSADEFLADQIPAVLLDASLYGSLSCETTEEGTVITFAKASSLEGWAEECTQAELILASGTATLDTNGVLTATTYHAEYSLSATVYTLDVSVTVTLPKKQILRIQQPEYLSDCTALTCFRAPRMLLQVVGNVYSSQAMTGSTSEMLYCEVASAFRTQLIQIDTYGSGDDFMAKTDYTVSLTDYANNTVSNTKTETFRNGVYSYTANNSGAGTQSGITAQQMRTYCEDALLAALFTPNYLADAVLTDTGDFYYLTFRGTDAFAEDLYDKVYSILQMDLDGYAPNYTTDEASGYLTVNKYTGLPTAMGLYLSRSHVIDKVSYKTTYQLDQSLNLSSATSFETITGEPAPETKPANAATPLFYKVTGTDGQTMWLLGTIHVGDARTGFLPQKVYDAFQNADALAVEFDISAFEEQAASDASLQAQLAAAYYYSDGSKASAHLDAELYESAYALILASGNNSINTPYMKVSVWNNLIENFYLQQDYSLTSARGVDQRLLAQAKSQGKTILDIETGLSQVQMLTGYSEALQSSLLFDTVSVSLVDYNRELRELYELWCEGDEAALTEAMTDDTSGMTEDEQILYDEYMRATITDRNAKMLAAAQTYLESGETVFYAVGLAHLLGENGLVNALRTAGYTVELVTYQ